MPELCLPWPQVDVWALGCVLHVLLCGVHPFQDGTLQSTLTRTLTLSLNVTLTLTLTLTQTLTLPLALPLPLLLPLPSPSPSPSPSPRPGRHPPVGPVEPARLSLPAGPAPRGHAV